MNNLPVFVSIMSHIFFNPVLFFMVALSIEKLRNEDENIRMMNAAGDHKIVFNMLAYSYVLGSIVGYGMFMTVLFGVLRLFGLVSGVDSFIGTQFNYHSSWRMVIVPVMAVNIFLWATNRKMWLTTGLLLGPALLVCTVAQAILFFKHLY